MPGWSKAMTRSSPSSVLTSVDLPTFGRPMIATLTAPASAVGMGRGLPCRRTARARARMLGQHRPRCRHGRTTSDAARPGRARRTRSPRAPARDPRPCSPPARPVVPNAAGGRRSSVSCGVTPCLASTRKTTTSPSAIAWRVCFAISNRMPSVATGSKPPVSTTRNGVSPTRARPKCRSRVKPGKSATRAARDRVSRLNNVDLPTFGRPTMTRVGSMA